MTGYWNPAEVFSGIWITPRILGVQFDAESCQAMLWRKASLIPHVWVHRPHQAVLMTIYSPYNTTGAQIPLQPPPAVISYYPNTKKLFIM